MAPQNGPWFNKNLKKTWSTGHISQGIPNYRKGTLRWKGNLTCDEHWNLQEKWKYWSCGEDKEDKYDGKQTKQAKVKECIVQGEGGSLSQN